MNVERAVVVLLLHAALGCGRDKARASAPPSAPSASAAQPSLATSAAVPAELPRASPAPSASGPPSAVVVNYSYDAGVNACRLVYGPLQLPFLGEVALVAADPGVLLVTHRAGVATVTHVVPTDAAPSVALVDAGAPHVTSPPCAVAGAFSFCMDPAGAIHRRPLTAEGPDVVIARGRPGTPFAADVIDSNRVVVVYLAERRTTEGIVSEAYAVLDDRPPLRISDEGSGTTEVDLARRGATLLALLLDGRVAMTPVHARTLTVNGDRLQPSEDAVVFVGGGAEARTHGALATSSTGSAFALVPISGETGFGVASVRIDDPPRTDEPSTWSSYLNGLDPAPIAATHGSSPIRVARVRPLEAKANAPRGLELGKLDEGGAFVSYGLVGSKGRVTSAALASDKSGALWLAFTDGTGTWLERRVCP